MNKSEGKKLWYDRQKNNYLNSTEVRLWLGKRDKNKNVAPIKYLISPQNFDIGLTAEETIKHITTSKNSFNDLVKKIHDQSPHSPIREIKECLTNRDKKDKSPTKLFRQIVKDQNFSRALENATSMLLYENTRKQFNIKVLIIK